MKCTIHGDLAQVARLEFEPGDVAWASRGGLMSHSSGLRWTLRVPGGLGGAVRRTLSGAGAALVHLLAEGSDRADIAASQPGKIMPWDLGNGSVLATRGSFVAAFGDAVDIDVAIARRAGAALFGGAGLFLQRVSGRGTALIHGSGDFDERVLLPGEELFVSTGHLAAFDERVDYDVQAVGGCLRSLFGGEGLFMTRLRGPGRVLLQTLRRQSAQKRVQVQG